MRDSAARHAQHRAARHARQHSATRAGIHKRGGAALMGAVSGLLPPRTSRWCVTALRALRPRSASSTFVRREEHAATSRYFYHAANLFPSYNTVQYNTNLFIYTIYCTELNSISLSVQHNYLLRALNNAQIMLNLMYCHKL